MASCAMGTVIDVAAWFLDRARSDDNYLQPQKLRRQQYCAWACYAQEYQGCQLMPASFVVRELGPVEPDIFRIFEAGCPNVVIESPPPEVEAFLERFWQKFARRSVESLTALVTSQPAYQRIAVKGDSDAIPFEIVVASISHSATASVRTRTADGRTVQKWVTRKAMPRKSP